MVLKIGSTIVLFLFGLTYKSSIAQDLVTECWSTDWVKYLEKCYLVVKYQHSWTKANEYCAKYGARLVEPTGHTVNEEISTLVKRAQLEDFWIGYNIRGIDRAQSHNGFWSDGRPTSVKVGVWGQNQPDPDGGECTYVKTSTEGNRWYTVGCDRVMPFVCEMDPCPTGMFQCSGRCISRTKLCDRTNDCDDNRDELNCPEQCTYTYQADTGRIIQETTNGKYASMANCQWTIETKPNTRVNVQIYSWFEVLGYDADGFRFESPLGLLFDAFETEENTDFLEIWNGGFTIGSSSIVSRLSGKLIPDQMTFTSSENSLIFRFLSDASLEKQGFELSWSTDYLCTYKTVPFFTFSNTEIQEGREKHLGGLQTYTKCEDDCDKSATCYGFTFLSGSNSCIFFSAIPNLAADDSATLYMKTCPPYTTLEASGPVPVTSLTATSEIKQLSTLFYPLSYMGDAEFVYSITAPGNNIITLEILDIELCCGDTVEIFDGTAASHTLIETLTSTSEPHLLLSTSPNVYIKMTLNTHLKCRGMLINFNKGCDKTLTETGTLTSPGRGTTIGYPGVMECTWTLVAPSPSRSITVVFEDCELEQDKDFLTISTADGSSVRYTGTELMTDKSHTANNFMTLTLVTSALNSARGFKASFSPGCSTLESDSVILDSNSHNYQDIVKMSCAEGYSFEGDLASETEVTLQCGSGGVWNVTSASCARGYCGPPPLIHNGYIVSGGVQGMDTATYMCDAGFTPGGSLTIKCNATGHWETPPSCTSDVCPPIGNVTSGVFDETIHGDGSQVGSVARLTCPSYSEIHGAATVKCVNGAWDFANGEATICHSKPCAAPLIDNAYFTPQQPYVLNQALTMICSSGYRIIGDSRINCGVTEPLPSCEKMKCNLNFENVMPSANPGVTDYSYGDSVLVKCSPQYEFNEFHRSTLLLTCLSTGQWDIQPTCRRIACGVPQQIKGAIYTPSNPCLDHDCNFTVSCKDKYQLEGASGSNDNVVICGLKDDGLWAFGDIRCIGGQCLDLANIPSGTSVATSFQEGSVATFTCKTGYAPVPPDPLVCEYNEIVGEMLWSPSTLPRCVDVLDPVISNCPPAPVKISYMQPAGFVEPTAADNTGVKSFEITPVNYQNFHPYQPIERAMRFMYTATDFEGRTSTCNISIYIPDFITCSNKLSLEYLVQQDETIDRDMLLRNRYIEKRTQDALLFISPETIQVKSDSSMLQRIDQIDVTARDIDGNEVETCRLQFRYKGYKCRSWGIHIPGGGGVQCLQGIQSSTCFAYCNTSLYFMEAPDVSPIELTCNEVENVGKWNRDPPVCATPSASYVAYTAAFDYTYSIENGIVSSWTNCAEVYKAELENAYPVLQITLQNVCNSNSQDNPVTLRIRDMTPQSLSYNQGANQLSVRLEVFIDLQDETVNNVLDLKDNCASLILTQFNTNTSAIASIWRVDGQTFPSTCGRGTYEHFSGSVNKYDCKGSRKYALINGEPTCLSCPLGYFLNVTNDNCLPCPDGTYGVDLPTGPECFDCPGRVGPGKTALTSEEQCSIPGICPPGYYSDDGLTPCTPCPNNFYSLSNASQTCAACPSDKVTKNMGSDSVSMCLTLDELGSAESPCSPNPCLNNGTCSLQRSDFFCTCASGFTGRRCITPFNACSGQPCKNDQNCIPGDGDTFSCQCSNEFEGDLCEIDISNPCSNFDLCKNNGTCHNQIGSHSCVCPAAGGFSNIDGTCGTPIDQCETNKCQEGSCIAHGSYYRSCNCYPGFTGIECETNIDDCDPNPCRNGGACVDGVDLFTCTCGSGFHGDFCQFEKACDRICDNSNSICHNCPADKTDRCENFGNSYICHCMTGYNGTHCEISDNACREYPCEHGGTCIVVSEDPGYKCECSEPWTGANCEREKSNCPVDDKCFNEGICYSTSSGFQCSCTSQFIGPSCNISYDLCGRVNACLGEGSNCTYTEEQGFKCTCGPGLRGDSCQIPDPTCSPDYCYNGGTCDDSTGSLNCFCKTGYEGPRCKTNTDDCSPDPCPQNANQQCIDGVNTYVCDCANGKRGENCDKDIGDFDYSIEAPQNCLLNEDVASFGDGSTVINEMSIAFWCRYTQKKGRGTILNIYGSVSGEQVLPASPDFMWKFDATEVTVGVIDNNKRKRRAERSAEYGVDIADGFWHHIVMTWTWSAQQGRPEMTIYVDGEYRDQLVETQPSITRGFVVFGDYDPTSGTGDADNSMQGRLSRLYVMEGVLGQPFVDQLYGRSNSQLPYSILLHQENNLMLQYTVDYNSEVTQDICVPPNVKNCQGLYTGDMPEVSNCEDVLAVTERAASPAWPSPTFTNTNPDTRVANRISEGGPLDWNVYGVSIAEYAQDNSSAAVCTFRLYNYPTGCTDVTSEDASCTSENGDLRCFGSCNSNEQLTGSNSAYQTCSKYSMWDEALRQEPYNYAACSDATPVKYRTRIALTVTFDNADCEDIRNNFIINYQRRFNDFDSKVNGGLCGGSCGSLLVDTFSCINNTYGELRIDFGLLPGEISLESQRIIPAEALKVAVADESVFIFEQSPGGPSVTPDLRSLMIEATAACDPGSQVSGTACAQCGSGTFYDETTLTCKRCPKGEYRDINDGDTTPTSPCKPCLPTTSLTTASDGSPSITYCKSVCLQGWYFSEAVGAAGACTQCPIGFYQPLTGQFSCLPCESDKTTDDVGKTDITECVLPESITTTPASTVAPVTPGVGAATEQSGLSTGVIVAVVLGVVIAILIVFLLVCFCCFKCQVPCLAKKTQEVTPEVKDKGRYYVDKYGENKMHYVNRNLADLREKKGRSLDKEPFVDPALSEESGSVKNDISIHVPVFLEKLDGSVSKKNVYMSDSIKIETPSHTQRLPMTSSPRANIYHNINFHDERKHKKKIRKRSKKPAELDDALPTQNGQIPKALAPMPKKLRSMPPEDIHLRPSSALERPRERVAPSHYEDILTPTSSQQANKPHSSTDTGSRQVYVSERGLIQAPPPKRDTRSPPSPELEMNHYEDYRYPMKRIEVESDQEDLR